MVRLYDAAVDAGLLAGLPSTAPALASRLALDEHAVRVVLDALAAWDVVEPAGDAGYRTSAGAPGPEAAAVLRHHARVLRTWSAQLDDRLRGVAPDQRPFDLGRVERMLASLTVLAREAAPGTVDACLSSVPGARRALDLGGGHGQYALELARRGVHVLMQDLPEVVDAARRRGLAEAGVELFAGDFFEVLPEGPFDLVLCSGVTHTYDGERNLELFRRIRPLLSPGGLLAVRTLLRGTDPVVAIFAVNMLVAARGGDTHGEGDYRRWLAEAGYGEVAVRALDQASEHLVLASA
ncbi:MAG: methyltransferase domain-containing protein [Actinomycetota bacterium]|nr:methyltransferase domain-containing protein [Actinomycetota bacterium]